MSNNQNIISTMLGIMSGTSLDGLDMAICSFTKKEASWDYSIQKAITLPYNEDWQHRLSNAQKLSCFELQFIDAEYGQYIGRMAKEFIQQSGLIVDAVASHGHTIFHQPEKGVSLQIGNGHAIYSETNLPVIYNFRALDVALGGQGAPLVPIGDKYLFGTYDACLNLGGFSNISLEKARKRIAFDICPVNIILNLLAKTEGMLMDKDGLLGKQGKVEEALLEKLNNISYYKKEYPKTLSREWLEKEFLVCLEKYPLKNIDKLRTVYEHISIQLAKEMNNLGIKNVLVTGGGAFNNFLIDLLLQQTNIELVIPDKDLINYKEALIFAFLGLLRRRQEINCLASVTGATKDSSSGLMVG